MSQGLSLHIGVNEVDPEHYQGWRGTLAACEFDAEDMQNIARAQGFVPTILLTRAATRAAVISAVRAAADTLTAGDIFFLSYSGHGGQLPDRNGDEADLVDETWCLHDGQLVDDELLELWAAFAGGVRILVLSDSCHSGTVTRTTPGAGPEAVDKSELYADLLTRNMPTKVAGQTYRENRAFYRDVSDALPGQSTPIAARVRLLSGCQDEQLSVDGTFNGRFTGKLLQVWRKGRFEGSYEDLYRSILKRMPENQTPNHFVFGGENPEFDGQRPFTI